MCKFNNFFLKSFSIVIALVILFTFNILSAYAVDDVNYNAYTFYERTGRTAEDLPYPNGGMIELRSSSTGMCRFYNFDKLSFFKAAVKEGSFDPESENYVQAVITQPSIYIVKFLYNYPYDLYLGGFYNLGGSSHSQTMRLSILSDSPIYCSVNYGSFSNVSTNGASVSSFIGTYFGYRSGTEPEGNTLLWNYQLQTPQCNLVTYSFGANAQKFDTVIMNVPNFRFVNKEVQSGLGIGFTSYTGLDSIDNNTGIIFRAYPKRSDLITGVLKDGFTKVNDSLVSATNRIIEQNNELQQLFSKYMSDWTKLYNQKTDTIIDYLNKISEALGAVGSEPADSFTKNSDVDNALSGLPSLGDDTSLPSFDQGNAAQFKKGMLWFKYVVDDFLINSFAPELGTFLTIILLLGLTGYLLGRKLNKGGG